MGRLRQFREMIYTGMTEIYAHRGAGDIWHDTVQVCLWRRANPETLEQKPQAGKVVWSDCEIGFDPPTAFTLKNEDAEKLMDYLWSMGIRPKDIGTPGHLAATQHHLNDMRAIVAEKLGVELAT